MTVPEFQQRKRDGKKIAVVTAYDALFARIIEEAGIEVLTYQTRWGNYRITVSDQDVATKAELLKDLVVLAQETYGG